MEKELYDVLVDGRDFGQKHYHFSREKSAEDFFVWVQVPSCAPDEMLLEKFILPEFFIYFKLFLW